MHEVSGCEERERGVRCVQREVWREGGERIGGVGRASGRERE